MKLLSLLCLHAVLAIVVLALDKTPPCIESHQACIPGTSTCCISSQHCILKASPLNKSDGSCVDPPSICPLPLTVTVRTTLLPPPKTCEKQTITATVTSRITEHPPPRSCEKKTATSTTTVRINEGPPPRTCSKEVVISTASWIRTVPTTITTTSISILTERTSLILTTIATTTVTKIEDPSPIIITITEPGSTIDFCATSTTTEPTSVVSSSTSATSSHQCIYYPGSIDTVPGWNYHGCYNAYDLGDSIVSTSISNNNAECSKACAGWHFFGTLNGETCVCTNQRVDLKDNGSGPACCDILCPGVGAFGICGGSHSISLWEADIWPPISSTLVSTLPSNLLSSSTLLTIASAVAPTGLSQVSCNDPTPSSEINGFAYDGCYADLNHWKFSAATGFADNSIEKCQEFCRQYSFFGTEGELCVCGNAAAGVVTPDHLACCNTACPGSTNDLLGNCGGSMAFSIWTAVLQAPDASSSGIAASLLVLPITVSGADTPSIPTGI